MQTVTLKVRLTVSVRLMWLDRITTTPFLECGLRSIREEPFIAQMFPDLPSSRNRRLNRPASQALGH